VSALLVVLIVVISGTVSGFVFYWAGRNTGESAVYAQQREKMDRLREANVHLKLQNERLRGLAGYPENVNTETAESSPGA
jgi:hypothetical protein